MSIRITRGGDEVARGLAELERHFDLGGGTALELAVTKSDTPGFSLRKSGGRCEVTYHDKADFFRCFARLMCRKNEEAFELSGQKKLKKLGVTVDCARNAVPKTDTLKRYILNIALLGYDYLGLYLEDCFRLEKYPKFGYMRGAYSEAELRSVVGYAAMFGLEVVPFIQTLGHLDTLFRHEEFQEVYDIRGTLLASFDRTYALIEEMLKTLRRCFISDRVNIGMDEAYMAGRGRYIEQFGYRESIDIFSEHLDRVAGLCEKYGFAPSMWSDRFIGMKVGAHHLPNLKYEGGKLDGLPKHLNVVYWDYDKTEVEGYLNNMRIHQRLFDRFSFAGSCVKCLGFAPFNRSAFKTNGAAFAACVKEGVEDYLLTTWSDNGAECSVFSALPGLIYVGALRYGEESADGVLDGFSKLLANMDFEGLLSLDLPNSWGGADIRGNPCKYLFYEDVLMSHPMIFTSAEYAESCAASYRILKQKTKGAYGYMFDTLARLVKFLEVKSLLGRDIKAAYDLKDGERLAVLAEKSIPAAIKRLKDFYAALKGQWLTENKLCGLEALDYRIGGVEKRLSYARSAIKDYLSGKTDKIPQLEEARLVDVDRPATVFDAMRIMTYGVY
ncbi:MAG: beta-N-acetylhexosaminidase [Clostridiales bacterium]|jgi:hypothetical protein|nr:beta-N-acetylhexosaminidase [Clostridiales bacterium]